MIFDTSTWNSLNGVAPFSKRHTEQQFENQSGVGSWRGWFTTDHTDYSGMKKVAQRIRHQSFRQSVLLSRNQDTDDSDDDSPVNCTMTGSNEMVFWSPVARHSRPFNAEMTLRTAMRRCVDFQRPILTTAFFRKLKGNL